MKGKLMKKKWLFGAMLLFGACGGNSGDVVGRLVETGSPDIAVIPTAVIQSSIPVAAENVSDPLPTVADELESAFATLMQARIECGRQPYSCDVATFTEVNSPIYNDLTELITTRRSARITATGGGEIRYRIDKTESLSPSKALVYTCITDDVVLVDGDIIFDDSMMSSLVTFTLTKVEGRWLWNTGTPTRWTIEEDLCGFDA